MASAASDRPATWAPWQPTSPSHRLDLQGLRAVAVLVIVAYHADAIFPGGFIGVDVFFVISGYVITRTLVDERQRTDATGFRAFYLRRIRRLLPALALTLVVTLLVSIAVVPLVAQQVTARTGAAAALLNANTYLMASAGGTGYFAAEADMNPLLHTWSLSVEEQFYLVFPALLVGGWVLAVRRGRGAPGVLVVLLVAVIATSLLASWALTVGILDPRGLGGAIAFYWTGARAWEFAVGALLAIAPRRIAGGRARWATPVAVGGSALVLASALIFDGAVPFPGTAALVPVIGTALVIAAGGWSATNAVSRCLATRPLALLGDLSYSWYLWHWPCIVFAAALWPAASAARVIAAIVGLVPAWLSYRWVERPIRFRPDPSAGRTVVLGLACIAAPLAAAFALEQANAALRETDRAAAFADHADTKEGCVASEPISRRDPDRCVWPAADARGEAVLIGDSNAGHLTEAFTAAANARGLDGRVVVRQDCPFVDLVVSAAGARDTACLEFVRQSVADLIEMGPEVVVISSATDIYLTSRAYEFGSPDGATTYDTEAEQAGALEEGLARVVQPLRDAGVDVVLVHPVPRLPPGWRPYGMAPVRLFGPVEAVTTSADRSRLLEARRPAFRLGESVARRAGAITLDVFDDVCPADRCEAYQDGFWRFQDANHISVEQSTRLAAAMGRALDRARGAW